MTDLASLREQIIAGEYRVDATSLASALLGHAGIEDVDPPSARDPYGRPGRGSSHDAIGRPGSPA